MATHGERLATIETKLENIEAKIDNISDNKADKWVEPAMKDLLRKQTAILVSIVMGLLTFIFWIAYQFGRAKGWWM